MSNSASEDREGLSSFERLAPFMLRSGIVQVGRQRLSQLRKRLAFILISEDISENSRKEFLWDYSCPVFQCLKSDDFARIFNYRGTKALGFLRSPLSTKAMQDLKAFKLKRDTEKQPRTRTVPKSGQASK
ncbi:MAG: hypothetical protein GX946_06835 [Oligosphaeraceae bacterium]|nr:hypothetical protein [Oligosphaeraceae bacterium]